MSGNRKANSSFISAALRTPSYVFFYRFYFSAGFFLWMLFLLMFRCSEVGFFVLVLINALFCADVFVRCAWKDLGSGKIGFPLLVSVAVYAGFLYSALRTFFTLQLFEPVTNLYLYVSFFLMLSLWIQGCRVREREKGNVYIKKIGDFLPKSGRKCIGQTTRRIFADELRPNDKVLVKAGERLPCDGIIVQGTTTLDEQFITGNVLPTYKQVGDSVYATTINKSADIYVTVTKPLASSSIMDIIQTVQTCEQRRNTFTTALDTYSAWTFLVLLVVAGGQYGFLLHRYGVSFWSYYSSVVLLILSLGAPVALLFAETFPVFFAKIFAVSNGIRLQNRFALDQLAQSEMVFFDKTGTLTYGRLSVCGVHAIEKDETALLEAAATAEQHADDPFAQAVMSYTAERNITPAKIASLEIKPGVGVRAVSAGSTILTGRIQWLEEHRVPIPPQTYESGDTVICVAKDGVYLGHLTCVDTLRPGAEQVVDFLKQQGKEVLLVSGDNEPAVLVVAQQVGIEKSNANVLPKTKAEIITNLRSLGKKVVMVGDGFNDIIALLRADAGIAFSSEKNAYNNWVDILISRKDLYPLMDLFKINEKIHRASYFNAVLSVVLSLGWTEFLFWNAPLEADWEWILGASLVILGFVLLNSMRLLRIK